MERKLAAIFALDTVGYSRLIEADEAGTLNRLKSLVCNVIEPAVQRHAGRIIKGTGDGVLAVFGDAGSALDCAAEIQGTLPACQADLEKCRRIEFRIGINLGEIYTDDGDIFGNDVNLAARIESLADPGGILISGSAYEQVRDGEGYGFEDLGPHLVKNIRTPVRVYRVLPQPVGRVRRTLHRLRKRKIVQWAFAYFAGAWLLLEMFDLVAEQFLLPVWIRQGATVLLLFGVLVTLVLAWYHGERGRQKIGIVEAALVVVLLGLAGQSIWMLKGRSDQMASATAANPALFRPEPLPQQSVAVLPCTNLSDDEDQGYFADGLAAELITRLAAVSGLRIPSHTSSFSFRGKNVTLESVAAALKVRHVLECDVFGDEARIRVGARLIDVQTGYTLWSESYQRARNMLLDVQDEVAQAVVRNLEIRLADRERLLVGRRWTENVEAYDQFLRGIAYQVGFPTEAALATSLNHLQRAVALDPGFGRAYARLAVHWVIMGNFGYAPPHSANAETERLARRAIELDGELFEAYWALGWAQFAGKYAWQDAELSFRKVIELAPGNWEGYHSLGFLQGVLGRYDEAMTAARIAIDLDPLAYWPRSGLEILYVRQRDYENSTRVILEMAARDGWNPFMRARMAWSLALAGREDEARSQLLEAEAANSQDVNVQLFLAIIHGVLGERQQALAWADPWRQRYLENADNVLPGTLAIVYASLGNADQAMEFLLEAREREDVELLFLDAACFDGMRNDPRFVELVRGLNLPENVYLSPRFEDGYAPGQSG